MDTGTLYVVGTPIGNLQDISQRALDVLKKVSIIACEDTRYTRKLLSRFDIHTRMESYHKFNERQKSPKLINILLNGRDVAIVSNAGMPCISDPGYLLIQDAINTNIRIVPVPGPTALALALAGSGLPAERFIFEGFLPRKKNLRIERLYSIKSDERTVIFYETARRIKNILYDIQKVFGNRRAAIARELTKKFEEFTRDTLGNILAGFPSEDLKGEFTIVVEGAKKEKIIPKGITLKQEVERLKKELDISSKEAVKLTAVHYNISKRDVYRETLK